MAVCAVWTVAEVLRKSLGRLKREEEKFKREEEKFKREEKNRKFETKRLEANRSA